MNLFTSAKRCSFAADCHTNDIIISQNTMILGKTKFKCDDCGHIFKEFDIELAATAYSQPMPCPKCGSRHTMPVSFFGCTDRETYKKIWEMNDTLIDSATRRGI